MVILKPANPEKAAGFLAYTGIFLMNKMVRFRFLSLILICFVSCKQLSFKEETADVKKVARAGNESLDINEFKDNFVSTGIINDSVYNAKKSIESWALESLFYQEAKSVLSSDEIDIEKKIDAYRRSLVNYIYQTKLIEANLDTVITNEEIEAYYNAHRESFILKENIVKVTYFKFPLKSPALPKIKKLLGSSNSSEKIVLQDLCVQNAENFFMNDSIWLFMEDVKKEMPVLDERPDFNLSPGRVLEFSDNEYYYYLKVKDVKVKNTLSPINFEIYNIKKFIINLRKAQLVTDYKNNLLEKAKGDKVFVIY